MTIHTAEELTDALKAMAEPLRPESPPTSLPVVEGGFKTKKASSMKGTPT